MLFRYRHTWDDIGDLQTVTGKSEYCWYKGVDIGFNQAASVIIIHLHIITQISIATLKEDSIIVIIQDIIEDFLMEGMHLQHLFMT